MMRDRRPFLAFVTSSPKLPAGRTEIEADWVLPIRGHRLTLDRPPRLGLRQSVVEALPRLASVLGDESNRNAINADARPHGLAVHREDPRGVVVTRMHDHRKAHVADLLGHLPADPRPLV